MGICDDWSYFRTVQLLVQTGKIHYNAWATAMIGWQLYAGAGFAKLFGLTYSSIRLTCIVTGAVTAFLMQRIFVRAGIHETNATIATLALVLSPLYLELSTVFMTDIPSVFAIVLCLYGCIQALQSDSANNAAAWICLAALGNAAFGTCRQIAWLGVLVMVPCALWILRRRRPVVIVGLPAMLLGWAIVFLSIHWLNRQPYAIPESVMFSVFNKHEMGLRIKCLAEAALEMPFLILPIAAAFIVLLPKLRRYWTTLAAFGIGYSAIVAAFAVRHGRLPQAMFEPRLGDWVTAFAGHSTKLLETSPPEVLHTPERFILTGLSFLSALCVALGIWEFRDQIRDEETSTVLSMKSLLILVVPFMAAYVSLLVPRGMHVMDRYLLPLAILLAIILVRVFQQIVRPALPPVTIALVALTGLYTIGVTHDMFAYYRAIEAAAAEVHAAGLPPESLDGSFEYNRWIEISEHGHINDRKIVNPTDAYIPPTNYARWTCEGGDYIDPTLGETPHFAPRYALSFDPDRCAGLSTFPAVSYTRWMRPGQTLIYIVNYQPPKTTTASPSR